MRHDRPAIVTQGSYETATLPEFSHTGIILIYCL